MRTLPYPNAHPPVRRDATRREWRLNKWAYSRSELTIVAPSHWMAEQAHRSMVGRFPVVRIPNGVDTEVLRPLDRAERFSGFLRIGSC